MAREQTTSSSWNRWGEWLTAVVAVGTTLGLAGAWAIQYFRVDGNARLIERVTYIVEDRSWMPPGVSELEPLVGLHYFGDLAIILGYGEALTPYIIPGMPAQYPPVAIILFKLLGLFGPHAALILLILLSAILLPVAVWKLMGGLSTPRRLVTLVILIWLTMPMISALDRGGLQFVAVGCLGLSILLFTRNRTVLAIVFFVIAVSLKSYLLVFIIYPLLRGHRAFAVKALVTAIVINGVLFLAFPGRPTVSFGGFLTSTVFYSTTEMVVDGNGLASLPLRFIEMTRGTDAALSFLASSSMWLTLLAVLWLAVVAWLASRREVPYWISMSLVLASATMVVGAAYPYNYAWAALAAFYFGSTCSDPFPILRRGEGASVSGADQASSVKESALDIVMRVAVLVTIALSLIPQFWIWDGPSGDGRRAVSSFAPAAIVLLTLMATGYWLVMRSRVRRARRLQVTSDIVQ